MLIMHNSVVIWDRFNFARYILSQLTYHKVSKNEIHVSIFMSEIGRLLDRNAAKPPTIFPKVESILTPDLVGSRFYEILREGFLLDIKTDPWTLSSGYIKRDGDWHNMKVDYLGYIGRPRKSHILYTVPL